jgi:hypothetical protein
MSKGLKNATQKTMRETIDSIFNYNPERHYGIRDCFILIRYAYYDFFEYEFSFLI